MTPMQHTASQVLNAFNEGKAEAVIRLYELGLLMGMPPDKEPAVRKRVAELFRNVGISSFDAEHWLTYFRIGSEAHV